MRKLGCLLFLSVLIIGGCEDNPPPTLPPATPGGGFIIESSASLNGSIPLTEAYVNIGSSWQSDELGASGDPTSFNADTGALGLAAANGKRAPAIWAFTWLASPPETQGCIGHVTTTIVALNEVVNVICTITAVAESVSATTSSFQMSPNPVYITTPPSTATVTGNGLSSTYGMPMIQYYTLDGTFVAQETASSVSNSTSMQISGFNVSQLPVGTYAAFVSNAGPNGTYTYIGNGAVEVADGEVTITGKEETTQVCTRAGCHTVNDSGSLQVTVNGVSFSASWGEGSTATSVAEALVNAMNSSSSSPVTAFFHGCTSSNSCSIGLVTKTTGAVYAQSASDVNWVKTYFTNPSFKPTVSGPTL